MQRSEITPTIYDYRDIKIDYLNKMFLKRNIYYRKIDKQASLFDDPIVQLTKNISEGGKFLEITVLDHLILTAEGFYSFADEGLI